MTISDRNELGQFVTGSSGFTGKHTPESIQQMRDAHKGQKSWNKGQKCPQYSERMRENNPMFRKEVRDKVSDKLKGKKQPWHSGEKSYLWKGGITAATQVRLNDAKWRNIRKEVFKRDNWTCQDCKTKSRKLNCHHIVPYRISKDNSKKNLITLCNRCHTKRERNIDGFS
jgi:5-methylcytosine-specific restriction endonuclease McrA